jgi:xanthine dehydrogenase YagT iron-sulfur-binding subunit
MPTDQKNPPGSGVSRRNFLKTVGAGAAAGSLVREITSPSVAEAQAESGLKGPGDIEITLNINGTAEKVTVEPRVTLLDALRNRMDHTGAKKVCDRGTCGACTVMLDGNPVYSCSMLAIEAEGHAITTVEGLGTPENLHAVQAAFIEHDAQQCGFCTPGFIVAAAALLQHNPNPTDADIQSALGGNLCRCGTYAGMHPAIMDAAKALKGGA